MALRKIRTLGDPVLQKVSKPITEVNDKIKELDCSEFDKFSKLIHNELLKMLSEKMESIR